VSGFYVFKGLKNALEPRQRMGGDSNPRYLLGTHAFQACALDHSATHPCTALSAFAGGREIVRQLPRSASPMCGAANGGEEKRGLSAGADLAKVISRKSYTAN
jgi:hypothetical protein